MSNHHTSKSGAALLIALGFLAVLTLVIIAFTTQTRTERLAGRAYLTKAQTRHLLNTALTRAMEDVDIATSNQTHSIFPEFLAANSMGGGIPLSPTLDFDMEQDYFPAENEAIGRAFDEALASAEWQTITTDGTNPIGRVGYIIINTSGLLDANHVGGPSTNEVSAGVLERRCGLSPDEIHLSDEILPELVSPASGISLVLNRDTQWHRFESLRDLQQLGAQSSPAIFSRPPENFCAFSFFPQTEENNGREYMGSTLDEIIENEDLILDALNEIGLSDDNQQFVYRQLLDYVDPDSIPQEPQLSVEPVPLLNELVLECAFTFTPEIEEVEDPDTGEVEEVVSAIIVSNQYTLNAELWYPFAIHENSDNFSLSIDSPLDTAGTIPDDLFGSVAGWSGDFDLNVDSWRFGDDPETVIAASESKSDSYSSANELIAAFRNMASDVLFPRIRCINTDYNIVVDIVEDIKLPVDKAVSAQLLPDVENTAEDLFNAATAAIATNSLTVGLAAIDPRLNWNTNYWVEVGDAGYGETLGDINSGIIDNSKFVNTPDPVDTIYVRNAGVIDSPFEFTYFLYDMEKPWRTFQFFREHDEADNTRNILTHLLARPESPRRHGWINPNSQHSNVLASAFFDMPMDEFVQTETDTSDRIDAQKAQALASILESGQPYASKGETYAELENTAVHDAIDAIIGGSTWKKESLLRNGTELFNPRDNSFVILLAAQTGIDRNMDGTIGDDETLGMQKAVAYIWRDPVENRAACVFWGLSDTLQSSISGTGWASRLGAFKPEQ